MEINATCPPKADYQRHPFAFLDKLELHTAGWGTPSGFSGNGGVSRDVVILGQGSPFFLHSSTDVAGLTLITDALCSQLTRALTPRPLLLHKVAL